MKPLCIQLRFMPHTVPLSRNVSFHIFLCFCWVIYIFLISFSLIISSRPSCTTFLPSRTAFGRFPHPLHFSSALPRLGADNFARPRAAPVPQRAPPGADTATAPTAPLWARGPGQAGGGGGLHAAPRPRSRPIRSSFGPHASPDHFPAAARGIVGIGGCSGSPRTLEGWIQAALSLSPGTGWGGDGLTCSRLLPSLLCRCQRGAHTAAPAVEAWAGDLLESSSGLIAPWHGPETLLCV